MSIGRVNRKLMEAFENATGNGARPLDGDAVHSLLGTGVRGMKDEFLDADSAKGLAAKRNEVVQTFKAADKLFDVTDEGYDVARQLLGRKLDGKDGSIALVEWEIRRSVRAPQSGSYSYS